MEYRFWKDDELASFVRENYPDFYKCCYSKYPKNIQRFDSARYLILHHYGGLYADLDYEACDAAWVRGIQGPAVVASPYPENEDHQNSLMVSPTPGHLFWEDVLNEMVKKMNKGGHGQDEVDAIFESTGPRMLDRALARCRSTRGKEACPQSLPVPQFNPKEPDNRCDEHEHSSPHTVHHLTTVWWGAEK